MSNIKAICFGEVLIDQFPTGDRPGGAPMNVAYHMKNLGTPAAMMSSVGQDENGDKLTTTMMKLQQPLVVVVGSLIGAGVLLKLLDKKYFKPGKKSIIQIVDPRENPLMATGF